MTDLIENDIPKDLVTRIKYKYWEIWPSCLRPMTVWYNFKCWAWHRYGTIRCSHLPHTWSDRRSLLLHASFEILTDFIDKECSPGHVLWYGEGAHTIDVAWSGEKKNVMDEMLELYRWWNTVYLKDYPAKNDALWDAVDGPKMLCVPYEGMPEGMAGQLDMVYRDDDHREEYRERIDEINAMDRLMDEQSEEMLKRLAAIRPWMWT